MRTYTKLHRKQSLPEFKNQIKAWTTDKVPCRLCKK